MNQSNPYPQAMPLRRWGLKKVGIIPFFEEITNDSMFLDFGRELFKIGDDFVFTYPRLRGVYNEPNGVAKGQIVRYNQSEKKAYNSISSVPEQTPPFRDYIKTAYHNDTSLVMLTGSVKNYATNIKAITFSIQIVDFRTGKLINRTIFRPSFFGLDDSTDYIACEDIYSSPAGIYVFAYKKKEIENKATFFTPILIRLDIDGNYLDHADLHKDFISSAMVYAPDLKSLCIVGRFQDLTLKPKYMVTVIDENLSKRKEYIWGPDSNVVLYNNCEYRQNQGLFVCGGLWYATQPETPIFAYSALLDITENQVSVRDENQKSDFSVSYSNYTKSIYIKSENSRKSDVKVYNLIGETVYQINNLEINKGVTNILLTNINFQHGVYFIEFLTNGKSEIDKFVVVK